MRTTLTPTQAANLKRLRTSLQSANQQDWATAVQEAAEELAVLELEESVACVEDACTRLGTAATYVPKEALALAKEPALPATRRAYAAVMAAIGFRRFGDLAQSREAVEILESMSPPWNFGEALAIHLKSLTHAGGGQAEARRALELSRVANELCPDNPRMVHAMAEFELEDAIWGDHSESQRKALLGSALVGVNRAIALGDWPKYHFTRARILLRSASTRADYDEALGSLDRAMQMESRASADSDARRARYQYEVLLAEMRIEMNEADARIRTEYQQVTEDAKSLISAEARRSQIQVVAAVGFLTSIIAILQFAAALFVTASKATSSDAISYWYLLVSLVVVALVLLGSVGLAAGILGHFNKKAAASQSRPQPQ